MSPATVLGCFGYSYGFLKWVALADLLHLDLASRLLPRCPLRAPSPNQPILCLLWFLHPLSQRLLKYLLSTAGCMKPGAATSRSLKLPPAPPRLSPPAHSTLRNSYPLPCLSGPSAAPRTEVCVPDTNATTSGKVVKISSLSVLCHREEAKKVSTALWATKIAPLRESK